MALKRTCWQILAMTMLALAIGGCGRDAEPAAPAVAATAIPAPAGELAATDAPGQAEEASAAAAFDSPLVAAGASPLATPVADSPVPTPTPEVSGVSGKTSATTGAVTGRILISRDGVDIPVGEMIIGLAEIIVDDEGVARASGYSPDTAKKGTTDEAGGFAVNEVPAGLYSLILDAVITSYQLESPLNGETILIEIEPGEVTDLGVLRYNSLPVPGFN
jgi:hypothetical protein